jgi:mRNA interferase MazF
VNRGEVWWVEHPEAGRRPACILTRETAIPVLTSVLVAPATRTVRNIPTEVVLDEDDGMPQRCALSLDNVAPVPKALLTERITTLSAARLSAAWRHSVPRRGAETERVRSSAVRKSANACLWNGGSRIRTCVGLANGFTARLL